MSKILKHLNKAKGIKETDEKIVINSDQLAVEATSEEYIPQEIQSAREIRYSSRFSFLQDILSGSPTELIKKAAIGLIGLVIIVALSSLLVSNKAIKEMKNSSGAYKDIMGDFEDQKAKIIALEIELANLRSNEIVPLTNLKSDFVRLTTDMQQAQKDVEELLLDQGKLKLSVDDLEVTDRLLLEKYISMDEFIKTLKVQ